MNRIKEISRLIYNRKFQLGILLLITLGISIQSYKQINVTKDGIQHTAYNNYLIFKNSSVHLFDHQNLYAAYPDEQFDLFKYAPVFALFMYPFHFLPDVAGLLLWNLLNLLVLYFALFRIPGINEKRKSILFWFVLLEMAGNMMYEQSNALIAGLLVFAFIFMEKDKPFLASLFIIMTVYIKLFGIVACILFFLYPKRFKLIGYSILWMGLLAVLPAFFTGFKSLSSQYGWWLELLGNDHGKEINFSLMGLLKFYLNIEAFSLWFVLCGTLILSLPLIRFNQYHDRGFRLLFASTVLMWLLIFNHMAEPSTFIIEMTGIGLWFFPFKRSVFDLILLLIALFLISLVGLDIFPHAWRDEFFGPYKIKAMPGILIWVKATLEALIPRIRPSLLAV